MQLPVRFPSCRRHYSLVRPAERAILLRPGQPTHGPSHDVNIPGADSEYGEYMAQTLLTLGRGLTILELVSASKRPVSANALSTSSGVNLSTTYQILRTLRDGEY